ncbi:MAG: radical SAM protein [Deltaproteobacteria bacterium]|nr:radical SAM protein [Deltaproteobacteria bacterium]
MDSCFLDDYLSRQHAKARLYPQPVEAMVELTYGCNLLCVHCYNPTHLARNELSTEKIFSILDQMAEMGTLQICFTGGEIFSRKDSLSILDYAKKKGFQIILLTNATLITPAMADRLQEIAPRRIDISLYGATRKTYERVTGVPGSFGKFLSGLGLLKSRGLALRLKSIILTLNLKEVEAMRRFSKKWGISFEYQTDVNPRVNGDRAPLAFRISPLEEARLWHRYVMTPTLKKGLTEDVSCRTDHEGPFDCHCGKSKYVITPYGQMNLCIFNYFPKRNVLDGQVAQSWRDIVDLVKKTKPTKEHVCPVCPVYDFCSRGPGDSWAEMGDVNACVPYHWESATLHKALWEGDATRRRQIVGDGTVK